MHLNGRTGPNRTWKTLAVAGGLTLAVIGLTKMTATASPPADEEVQEATDAAERAAAAESTVRTLRLNTASTDAEQAAREHAETMASAAGNFEPVTLPTVPDNWVAAGLDLEEATENDAGELVQELPDGSKVTFTVDPAVQRRLEAVLDRHPVPHGSIVLIDPPTGRVVGLADRSRRDQNEYTDLALNANPPSASVFKVITAAALLEETDLQPHDELCYHGGARRLTERNITGHPDYDTQCNNLEGAVAYSINSIIAQQTYHNLSREDLIEWAERFGYNEPIPFELPVGPSTARFGDDPYENARAAAGFWHTHLSPLHGAMIGAAFANDGVMMEPTIIERYECPDGELLHEARPEVFREVMSPDTARQVSEMMEATVHRGTGRNHFHARPGFPSDVNVAGKTGTLTDDDPFTRFTWFVGFGERNGWDDHPGVAVAGLMGNDPAWYMLGPQAASAGLRHFFEIEQQRRTQPSPEQPLVTSE